MCVCVCVCVCVNDAAPSAGGLCDLSDVMISHVPLCISVYLVTLMRVTCH